MIHRLHFGKEEYYELALVSCDTMGIFNVKDRIGFGHINVDIE